MTRDEAKDILLLYRPETPDADDPEIAAALAFARQDAELAVWLEAHSAQQKLLREKMRRISVPAGLKEQIISERISHVRQHSRQRVAIFAAVAVVFFIAGWWINSFRQSAPDDDTFANYRQRMISTALRGYAMDLESTNLNQIHDYLAHQKAPENYELPAALKKSGAVGCAVESWQDAKVAMICFRTRKTLPSGEKSDLWLFVVDRASVKNAPSGGEPEFAKVNKLETTTWTKGDKLYLLGTAGDIETIRQWL